MPSSITFRKLIFNAGFKSNILDVLGATRLAAEEVLLD